MTFDELVAHVRGNVKKPLTDSQCERVEWALTFTQDALDSCEVPTHLHEKELQAVAQELVEEFDKGGKYPNSSTEMVWTKRNENGWKFGRDMPTLRPL